jgi:hypothetical protein
MRYREIFFVVLFLSCFVFTGNVFASEVCFSEGYTVVTINGIFNDEIDAIRNKDKLEARFNSSYKSEPLFFDYLYNPTHLAGLGDLIDVLQQGILGEVSDYDLVEMINDASEKVKTQKVLLIAHSQGNFYANNFYDEIASAPGGIPKESFGVYGVATPADKVSGGGRYLTSDTDQVIAGTVAEYIEILPPNIHIPLNEEGDNNGHSFSDVYLKYQSGRIVSDIKYSLSKLRGNDEQELNSPCISKPEMGTLHKTKGAFFFVADPLAELVASGVRGAYDVGMYLANGASKVGSSMGNTLRNLMAGAIETSSPEENDENIETNEQEDIVLAQSENKKEEKPKIEEVFPKEEKKIEEKIPEEKEENIVPPKEKPHKSGGGGSGSKENKEEEEDKSEEENEEEENEEDENPVSNRDETPPVISIVGENIVNINRGDEYTEQGAVAFDEKDGNVEVVISGEVNTGIAGVYVVTYTAVDFSNNTSQVFRTVNVLTPEPEEDPEPEDEDLSFSDLNNNQIADKDEEEVESSLDQFLLPGEYRFNNLVILGNSTLTLKGDPSSLNDFKGVKIYAKNITIKEGSLMSADKEGYGQDSGPGRGEERNQGASYGGISLGSSQDATYGSAKEPIDLGSGGAANHSGGGAMYFVVSDTFINDGIVSSVGDRSSSGGSIYLQTSKLKGDGSFRADGGGLYFTEPFKSPGGGGRIAIYYEDSTFEGEVKAEGGCGSYDGWSTVCSGDGTVGLFDEENNDLYINGNSWKFLKNEESFSFRNIYVKDGAEITSEEDVRLVAENFFIENSIFTLGEGQEIDVENIFLDDGSIMTLFGDESITTDFIGLSGGSEITVSEGNTLYLEVKNVLIDASSRITASKKGYNASSGPGAPTEELGGASYGGLGHLATASSLYGSKEEPEDYGSGGRGNHTKGGGAIKLVIEESLTNNGLISADGDVTSSGGSLYVRTGLLDGSGIFSANGGISDCPSVCYGPGGGGRIAIYYEDASFTGEYSAKGWSGWGGASEDGTIYLPDKDSDPDLDPNPDPNNPNITEYTLNGNAEDLTINPLEEPVVLAFTANKNVLWVSLKIESEVDSGIYKYFYPGDDCDNKNVCAETWNGDLSSDKDLLDGIYKIKIHLKDSENREFDDYLPSHKIIVETIQEPVPLMSPTEETKIEPEFVPESEPESEPETVIETEEETETISDPDEETDPGNGTEEGGDTETEGEQGESLGEEEIPPEV